MNRILKKPLAQLGSAFVEAKYLLNGEDEYRFRTWEADQDHRPLNQKEIQILEANLNQAQDWKELKVKEGFNPHLVKNCRFFGFHRIGALSDSYLEFKNLRMPVGLYNSTFVSCDIGDDVALDRINLCSHYQIESEVMILQVNELATTPTAKFGEGVVKEGEDPSIRIWMELANENGGRKVIPFLGMTQADAYLWINKREDKALQQAFVDLTLKTFEPKRGVYGRIQTRSVIKNTGIIKDVHIGSDTYIKGANKLKNLSILSNAQAPVQIGEGCELVNGIIHEGSRIFYGVKAVRFILGPFSQLKYGARLLNAYLGDNSTISCCEVLNSLIYPFHEQHHNNSFLCAAVIQGQSNMAAGATLGSNHNSRGADGELHAGRGFWPGLSVALKHNSRFASFNLISKGNYPAEIHNPIPFSLIGNDEETGALLIIPAYWFQYNMYALARNAWKFQHRDQRLHKNLCIELDYLAPDTMFELLNALHLFETWAGAGDPQKGKIALEQGLSEVWVGGLSAAKKPSKVVKLNKAYQWFQDLIHYHAAKEWLSMSQGIEAQICLNQTLDVASPIVDWVNLGGQLVPKSAIEDLERDLKDGRIQDWEQIHERYYLWARNYPAQKFENALNALMQIQPDWDLRDPKIQRVWLQKAMDTAALLKEGIAQSRAKDFKDPFRLGMFQSEAEMHEVLGKSHQDFIQIAQTEYEQFALGIQKILD